MDIVIPLGRGSRCDDLELKYALRSVEKNLSGVGKVLIICAKMYPNWLKNVTLGALLDLPGNTFKERNIFEKTIRGGGLVDGDSFLFMNDDHYILQPFEASQFPYHHKGLMYGNAMNRKEWDPYGHTLRNTIDVVGKEAMNYDTHCPIVFDKGKYLNTVAKQEWDIPFGYAIKTLYCELNGIKGEFYEDLKTDDPRLIPPDRLYFSSRIGGPRLFQYLEKMFPHKSKYER